MRLSFVSCFSLLTQHLKLSFTSVQSQNTHEGSDSPYQALTVQTTHTMQQWSTGVHVVDFVRLIWTQREHHKSLSWAFSVSLRSLRLALGTCWPRKLLERSTYNVTRGGVLLITFCALLLADFFDAC